MSRVTGIGVLDKVMAVLDVFETRDQADPPSVAGDLGISIPTAYRLMKAMAVHGLLAVNGDGKYQLGLRLLHLSDVASSRFDLIQRARPHLTALRDATGESVELQVLIGCTRVPVHMESGTRSVRTSTEIGIPLPLHKGSSSRALLLHHSEDEALALARRSAEDCQELSSFDEVEYLTRWRRARARGYDVGFGERDPEVGAAAAPVCGPAGMAAAQIVVSGTARRFRDRDHSNMVVSHLQRVAAALNRDLDGSLRTEQGSAGQPG